MKTTIHKTGLYILLLGVLCSCVNTISGDDGEEIVPGETPVLFSIGTGKGSTRVADGRFTAGDRMGLYATVGSEGIGGTRYVENLLMTSIDGERVSMEREVYYPIGGHKLNFWSYYPYRSKALAKGETSIKVSVKTDQRSEEGVTQSDFMTSQVRQVAESGDAVTLDFEHQLTRIELSLKPSTGGEAQALLEKGISVTATNFYTTAEYDFATGQVTNPTDRDDIRTYGGWRVENDSIVGGCFLIVPQKTNNQQLVISIGGNQQLVQSTFEGSYEKGKSISLQVSLDKDNPSCLKGTVTSIKDWKAGELVQRESTPHQNELHLRAFEFGKHRVHHIYKDGIPVGEICMEYLRIPDQLDIEAIVHYPMSEGRADLSRGTVLEVQGKEEENVHRGSVSWNTETGIPDYTPGQGAVMKTFGIKESGELVTEEDGVPVNVISWKIADNRGNIVRDYPVVKIGTQYWLAEDLDATRYTDGTPLTKLDKPDGRPGYLTYTSASASYIYYTGELLQDTRLAPSGCRIPTPSDWDRLIRYVGEKNAAALKSGGWESYENVEMNNKTGFGVRPQGYFLNHSNAPTGLQQNTYYWKDGDTPGTISPESTIICFSYRNNTILSTAHGWSSEGNGFHALSIRCLVGM